MTESTLLRKADESVATGGLMPMASLLKHYKLGFRIFVVVALLGIPFAILKGKSFYSASAAIYIAPRLANILNENRESEIPSYTQYKQFMEHQSSTVGRYDILLEALDKLGDKRFYWQLPKESNRRAAERLQGALVIKPVSDTYLLSVTLESDEYRSLDEIVNTVVETYIQHARDEQWLYASKERIEVLDNERERLQSMLDEKKKQLAVLSQQLSVTVFVDSSFNPYDQLLASSQGALAEAQRERMAAEAGLLLFEDPNNSKNSSAALEAIVADIVYKDNGLNSLKYNMYQRRSELVKLISGLDPNHPGHGQIKKQLEVIEAEVQEAIAQLTTDVRRMLIEERRSKVTLTRKIEHDLEEQINNQKKNAAWFSTNYNTALSLTREIKNYTTELEKIQDRISFLELESKAPGFVRLEVKARPPILPIRGGRTKLVVTMAIVGLVLGLVVPILIDMLNKTIRTVGQVEKLLGFKPVAGLLEPGQGGSCSEVIAGQRRRLALALLREKQLSENPRLSVLLTGVDQQSGATCLAFELAKDFCSLDERAVVVEVNPVHPDQRYVSQHTRLGLLDLMRDPELQVSQVVSPADADYPERIALGLHAEELLTGYQRLQTALAKIAAAYPVVILDAAPILFAPDTEFFIGVSDITLLLIAAEHTKPPEIKRTVQLLEKAEPKAVGFVVTRLLVFKGGGYYASLIGVEGSAVKIIANAAAEKYRSFKNTGLFKRLEKLNPFAKFNLFARFKKKP